MSLTYKGQEPHFVALQVDEATGSLEQSRLVSIDSATGKLCHSEAAAGQVVAGVLWHDTINLKQAKVASHSIFRFPKAADVADENIGVVMYVSAGANTTNVVTTALTGSTDRARRVGVLKEVEGNFAWVFVDPTA